MPATIRMGDRNAEGAATDAVTRVLPTADPPANPPARECPTCAAVFSGASRFCPFDGEPLRALETWRPGEDDPLLGREIGGRYRLESVLGEGGMGKVYAARHVTIDKPCAIKVLRRDVAVEPEATARFLQEAKLTASLSHPNLVAVSDFGELQDAADPSVRLPWFVMERLHGETLAQRLRRDGPLSLELTARIGRECAEGLAVAHANGIVHRDLKPDNVFLAKVEGREAVTKLLDFGVAKVAGASQRTRKGMTFGTPHYMSPEQATGGVIDGRADLYALGIILYECLAGEVPFQADSFMGVLTKHVYETPEPLERKVEPALLGGLGAIVARCLAKRPADRWEDAAALARALADVGSGAAATAPLGKTSSTRARLRSVLSRPPPDRSLPTVPEGPDRARTVGWSLLAGLAVLAAVVAIARFRGAPSPPEAAGALPGDLPQEASVAAPPPPVPSPTPSSARSSPEPAATAPRPPASPAPPRTPRAAPPPSAAAPPAEPSSRPARDREGLVDPWND